PDRIVGELLSPAREMLQDSIEVGSLDMLEHEHEALVVLEEIEHPNDGGGIELRDDRRFTRELLREAHISFDRAPDELERTDALEPHRSFEASEVEIRGGRTCEASYDLVRSDPLGNGLRREHSAHHSGAIDGHPSAAASSRSGHTFAARIGSRSVC